MVWISLVPAAAVVLALVALSVGLQRVEDEVVALRRSLRRTSATAVAADEASRAADRLRERSDETRADAQRRLGRRPRWWSRPSELGR